MNIKHLIASISLLAAAGAALADGRTRAEVQAEVIQARAAGTLDVTEADLLRTATAPSTLTREQVRADVLAARTAGVLEVNEGNYPREYAGLPVPKVEARLQASAVRTAAQR